MGGCRTLGTGVLAGHTCRGVLVFAIPSAFYRGSDLFTITVLTQYNRIYLWAASSGGRLCHGRDAPQRPEERDDRGTDPFYGVQHYALATKYWTVAEKNRTTLDHGLCSGDRLSLAVVGALIFGFSVRCIATTNWG